MSRTNPTCTKATPDTGRAVRTHYRVHIVSEAFRGKSRVERHRLINTALAGELAGGIHALAIHADVPGG